MEKIFSLPPYFIQLHTNVCVHVPTTIHTYICNISIKFLDLYVHTYVIRWNNFLCNYKIVHSYTLSTQSVLYSKHFFFRRRYACIDVHMYVIRIKRNSCSQLGIYVCIYTKYVYFGVVICNSSVNYVCMFTLKIKSMSNLFWRQRVEFD